MRPPRPDEMWLAVNQKNSSSLKTLLARGGDARLMTLERGCTLLMRACELQDRTSAKLLIDAGADVNGQDTHGTTALLSTVLGNDLRTACLLLDHGADPNIPNKSGRAPLIWAVRNGNDTLVGRLLAAGADLGAKDETGRTAMDWAALQSRMMIINILQTAADERLHAQTAERQERLRALAKKTWKGPRRAP